MEFQIFSKALYSTWILYRPERVLFDVGEGISTVLGNSVYAIKDIFLTHGHVDHISGLWGLINTRNTAMGDRNKQLRINFPSGNRAIEAYLDFIIGMNPRLRYNMILNPLNVGDEVYLRTAGSFRRHVTPFRVKHTIGEISYGYHIYEERRKLKEIYGGLSSKEIASVVKEKGREAITDTYLQKIVTISGDTFALPPEVISNSETLLHECTFLVGEDRRNQNHSSIDEVIYTVRQSSGIKRLILYHISGRYTSKIKKWHNIIKKELEGTGTEVFLVHPEHVFEL
ncbi:MAG: MBL fold metallo-hydrolase [Kosmotogaceae bacterium]|nr:MBL fold metallo-hydrolase [Kosmotogaceae bacterium]